MRDDTGWIQQANEYASSRERLASWSYASVDITYYAWGGSQVLAEYTTQYSSSSLTWQKSYVYAGSRLLSTITNTSGNEVTEYHHPDRLGTRLISNPVTATQSEQLTLPFGTLIGAETSATNDKRFTSYDRSEIAGGLDYAVNRNYNSGQSRFTQVDPIGMSSASIGDPQSLNLFAYVQNNPIDFVDPSGLQWVAQQECRYFEIINYDREGFSHITQRGWLCQTTYRWIDDNNGGLDDLRNEVKKKLDTGSCRSKLNELLKELGKGKIKDKKTGKTGFDALAEKFYRDKDRLIFDQSASRSSYDGKKITLAGSTAEGQAFEFIHEALHGAKSSGYFFHQDIVKAIAKIEGVDFKALKNGQEGIKGKKANDSSLYEAPMNTWLSKYCGGGDPTRWDKEYYEKYKLP